MVLHLGINFKSGAATPEHREEVESILNQAKDWFRYAPNCWLIYTALSPVSWHAKLKKLDWISDHTYLIVEVDPDNKSGWLARSAWDWINQKKDG